MKMFFVAACCACTSLTAIADDWVNSGINFQIVEYTNTTRIAKSSNVLGTWILDLYPVRDDKTDYVLSWREFDCRMLMHRTKEATAYDSSGRVIGDSDVADPWTRVRPGSIGEASLRIVCSGGGQVTYSENSPHEVAIKARKALDNNLVTVIP